MEDKQIRVFDMFCGGGGSSRGAVMAGATPVAGLDMWELAAKTYERNFPGAKVYQMKASSLSPERIRKEVGEIDLLLASPECTNHSVAKGNKERCENSRATAFEVVRMAKALRPRWIVVENVIQMQKWQRFNDWYNGIKEIGYKTDISILNAQYFGTPQSRRRLFVVGDLEAVPFLPNPNRLTKKTVEHILGAGESADKPWAFSPVESPGRADATIKRYKRAVKELGNSNPFIMVYYGTDGAGGFQAIDRPLRTVTTLDRFAYVKPNGSGYEMRMLQPTELSKAMGFPSQHIWIESTRRERIKLIGNAVCPPVMKAVIKSLIK